MPDQQAGITHSRPLPVALLIMFLGPLLGAVAVFAASAPVIGWWLVVPFEGTGSIILDWYMLGGIQSTICAIIVGWHIQRGNWMSFQSWLLLTALVSLISAIIFHFTIAVNSKSDLFPTPLSDDLLFFTITTFFASLVLRIIVIGLGWMLNTEPVANAVEL